MQHRYGHPQVILHPYMLYLFLPFVAARVFLSCQQGCGCCFAFSVVLRVTATARSPATIILQNFDTIAIGSTRSFSIGGPIVLLVAAGTYSRALFRSARRATFEHCSSIVRKIWSYCYRSDVAPTILMFDMREKERKKERKSCYHLSFSLSLSCRT